jgi:hypothetical protein
MTMATRGAVMRERTSRQAVTQVAAALFAARPTPATDRTVARLHR